jgi:putative transposase
MKSRKLGICHSTFYKWKQKYGGLLPSEVKKLKSLDLQLRNKAPKRKVKA